MDGGLCPHMDGGLCPHMDGGRWPAFGRRALARIWTAGFSPRKASALLPTSGAKAPRGLKAAVHQKPPSKGGVPPFRGRSCPFQPSHPRPAPTAAPSTTDNL